MLSLVGYPLQSRQRKYRNIFAHSSIEAPTSFSLIGFDPAQIFDAGMWIVHRQLIRVIASMIGQICYNGRGEGREIKWCLQLQKAEFIPSLLAPLSRTARTPSLLCLEFAELLVLSVKETYPHTPLLSEELFNSGGGRILADNLVAIGVFGTREQQVIVVKFNVTNYYYNNLILRNSDS